MTNLFINFMPDVLTSFKRETQAWHELLGPRQIETVYISCAQGFVADQIVQLLSGVQEFFDFAERVEATAECDQNQITRADLKTLHDGGVTRMSFSALKPHPRMDEFNLFHCVNFDVDIVEEKRINRVVDIGQAHVSLYGVETYAQFEKHHKMLEARWLYPYDRHHFCGQGFECQYLINVLRYEDYIGIGRGAHSRVKINGNKALFVNDGEKQTRKILSERDVLEEFLLQNLSLYQGMDLMRFNQIFDRTIFDVFTSQTIEKWLKQKQIDLSDKRMRLCGESFFTPELIVKEVLV